MNPKLLQAIREAAGKSDWNPIDNPQDTYRLLGKLSPGVAIFKGLRNPREWQDVRGPGISGGFSIGGWNQIAKFSTEILLWDTTTWSDWREFRTVLARHRFSVPPKALDIWHPQLELIDPPIRAVLIEDVAEAELIDETGLWKAEVFYRVFNAPKMRYEKPDAAKDKVEEDPYNKEIAARTARNEDYYARNFEQVERLAK